VGLNEALLYFFLNPLSYFSFAEAERDGIGVFRLKRALLVFPLALIFLMACVAGCGYSAPAPTTSANGAMVNPNASGLASRVFITNQQAGVLQIVDASKDVENASTVTVGSFPSFIVVAPTAKISLVYDTNGNTVQLLDNTQEEVVGSVTLPSFTESIVITPDGKTAYAALPGLGQVVTIDVTNKVLGATVLTIPGARRLVMSHNGNTILVFNNGTGPFSIINTADNTMPAVPAGFNSPFNAVFSSDDTKAYVLNCGPECGGTTAGVNVVNIGAGSAATLGPTVAVPGGATVGAADATNLYVAGTPTPGVIKGGRLSAISLSSLTVSSSVPISDGLHTTMALASNNKLYVGAQTCTSVDPVTQAAVSGCLSLYNISAPGASLSAPLGDVTAIQPIKSRNVVYAVQGGKLQIYDTTSDTLQPTQINIVGKAFDAKAVDQ
jgi:DNA-binding beta-propeller fold protein YncE